MFAKRRAAGAFSKWLTSNSNKAKAAKTNSAKPNRAANLKTT